MLICPIIKDVYTDYTHKIFCMQNGETLTTNYIIICSCTNRLYAYYNYISHILYRIKLLICSWTQTVIYSTYEYIYTALRRLEFRSSSINRGALSMRRSLHWLLIVRNSNLRMLCIYCTSKYCCVFKRNILINNLCIIS